MVDDKDMFSHRGPTAQEDLNASIAREDEERKLRKLREKPRLSPFGQRHADRARQSSSGAE